MSIKLKSSSAILIAMLGITILASYSTIGSAMISYAEPSISVGCGPTQESNLSISVNISGFSHNSFLQYKYVRSDNSMLVGGFSTGPDGRNFIAVNTGPSKGAYTVYIYQDAVAHNTARPIYYSTITLPCIANNHTAEYYKIHPQAIQSLMGIQSVNNQIKLGNYLVASSTNAVRILEYSSSNNVPDQLAAQLLAAELNISNGARSDCISKEVHSANILLMDQKYNGPANAYNINIGQSDALYNIIIPIKEAIEQYNHIGCLR